MKIKIDLKAEVLSKKFQDSWRFSKIESLEANIFSEDMMKIYSNKNGSISIPRRIYLSHPRDNEVSKSE